MKKGIYAILAALTVFALVVIGCDTDGGGGGGNQGSTNTTYTVTFSKNTNDADSTEPSPATRTVTTPATTVAQLPTTPPTRPNYVFQKYTIKADGSGGEFTAGPSGTKVTGNMTVYAQWKAGYKITFDANYDNAPEPEEVEIDVTTPGETVTLGARMPANPTRDAFTFAGWNLLAEPEEGEEDDTAFNETTDVNESITVFAQWEFIGGTPAVVDGKLVHNLPLFELNGDTNTGVINSRTGTYKGSGGNFDYKFPDEIYVDATAETKVAKYDYFVVLTEITNGITGNLSGIQLQRYNSSTAYTDGSQNKMPWLDNADGKKMLLYVSGAANTGGFRIFANGTNTAEFKVLSITFYKIPEYTVTFKYNYIDKPAGVTQPDDVVVTGVKGKDENQDGTGVTAAKWPKPDPDRTSETKPWFFLGWEDADGNSYTDSTPVAGDTTLLAGWTDTEPEGWMELVTNNSTSAPLYAFKIPAGDKLGNYRFLSVKVKASGADLTAGRLRAWGVFPTTMYTEASFPDNADGKPQMTNSTTKSMQNAANGLLLTNSGGQSNPNWNGSISLLVSDGWKAAKVDLVGGRDANYGTTTGDGEKWNDDMTDRIVLIAAGIIAQGGGSGPRTYIIKDIFLVSEDGTKEIEAMDPRDAELWDGKGESAYVYQSGSGPTTRTRMFYQ